MANHSLHKPVFNPCIFIILLLGTAPSAKARIPPGPAFTVPDIPFGTNPDYRGNWCDKQPLMSNETLKMERALENETITLVVPRGSAFINYLDRETGVIDPSDPGLLINLINDVADRGGFKWEYGVVDYSPIFANDDYVLNDLLVWTTNNFDVVVDWWLQLPSRVQLGLTFPKGWYNADIIAVGIKGEVDRTFEFFSWKGPFSNGVWILLMFTLLFSGLLCFILEKGFTLKNWKLQELSRLSSDVTDHTYMSMIVFTGHMNLKTKTKPGQLVSFSLSLFAMLMISSYTANLASFLVIKNTQRSVIDGVDGIVDKKMSMCIIDAAKKIAIESVHPDAKFVFKNSEPEVFEGLDNNECDFAITSTSAWREIKDKEGYNWGCKMEQVGNVFQYFDAGFVVKSDSGVKCSSLVRDVFHVHLLNMHAEEVVKNEWDKHLEKSEDEAKCTKNMMISQEDSQNLNVTNMGGIFIFHFILLALAVLCNLIGKWHDRQFRQPSLVKRNSMENSLRGQFKKNRFYSFVNSLRGSSALKEFPINSDVSRKKVDFKSSFISNVKVPGEDEFLRNSITPSLYADQNKRIDELSSDVKDLSQLMGVILEKLDKIDDNEDRNYSPLLAKENES